MTPEELLKDAKDAKQKGCNMTLLLSETFRRPPGFPRGELLSDNEQGRVFSFNPDKIIQWLESTETI